MKLHGSPFLGPTERHQITRKLRGGKNFIQTPAFPEIAGRPWRIVAVILCIIPIISGYLTFYWIVGIRHLTLEK